MKLRVTGKLNIASGNAKVLGEAEGITANLMKIMELCLK